MACQLPHELIVWEILVRLPVKSLLRLNCVCKAWRDAISGADPSFSQAHLRLLLLHQQDKKLRSLLIAPRIKSKTDADVPYNMRRSWWIQGEVATPGLYLWEEERRHGVATLLHDTSSFPAEEANTRRGFAHCHGLVLLPAEDTVHVLNPATGRVLKLPWSPNSIAPRHFLAAHVHQAFGFGHDRRSNVYKVARFFYCETCVMGGLGVGMEVFTIGKDQCWRQTAAQPPYQFLVGRIATFFKGSLVWTVDPCLHIDGCDRSLLPHLATMMCFARFSLEDESFSVITGPPWHNKGPDYLESSLAELNGGLVVSRLGPSYESLEIWMCNDAESNNSPRWEQRHAFNFSASVRVIATFDDEVVYQDGTSDIWRQTHQGNNMMVDMIDLKYYNSYTGTLVKYHGRPWRTLM